MSAYLSSRYDTHTRNSASLITIKILKTESNPREECVEFFVRKYAIFPHTSIIPWY